MFRYPLARNKYVNRKGPPEEVPHAAETLLETEEATPPAPKEWSSSHNLIFAKRSDSCL